MKHYLELELAGACLPSQHSPEQNLNLWQQAEALLQNKSFSLLAEQGYGEDQLELSIQLKGLSQALNSVDQDGPLFSIQLTALSLSSPDAPKALERAAGVVLQQLYLALNLSLPGAGQLLACRYQQEPDFYPPPSFAAQLIERAWQLSHEWHWPQLRQLAFSDSWHWLEQQRLNQVDIAVTSSQKACFTLLELAETNHHSLNAILPLGHVLELLTHSEEAGFVLCEQRLQLILGRPARHEHWLHKFQELRQALRQGQRPQLRPGNLFHQQALDLHRRNLDPKAVSAALAVILALLQNLILNQSNGFQFSEHYQYVGQAS